MSWLRFIPKLLDLGFGVAERVVRLIDDRKAKKRAAERKGLSHAEVERIEALKRSAARPFPKK